MSLRRLLIPLLAFPAAALAECPQGTEPLVSCTFRDGTKTLTTCLDGSTVTYAYGATGHPPELTLRRDVTLVDLRPWNGWGRWLNEGFTFENLGFLYTIRYAIDRLSEDAMTEADLWVGKGDDQLAHLFCDPGSVTTSGWPLSLFDAKEAAGQVWDRETETWSPILR